MICRRVLHLAPFISVLFSAVLCSFSGLTAQVHENKNGDSGLKIRFDNQGKGPDKQRFVVTGLRQVELQRLAETAANNPDAWLETMVVTVASRRATKPRPMLGDYSIEGETLIFSPRYPLRRETKYRVEVITDVARKKPTISRIFELAARATSPPTRLLKVYPTANVLPENQLKFYLQFSSAMSRGEAYRRVKLFDQSGKRIEFPFLELGEELWDPSGSRFTLFFDPGRIKRGLKPRELFGPALEEGRSYTLVIDQLWQDASGRPLKAAHRKQFKVAAPDDSQPTPDSWQIIPPIAETRQPLVVSFGEPLDHAMLQRVLTVARNGDGIAGRIVVSKQESQWSFQPDSDWVPGRYFLAVDSALEDLAGNSIGRPFEVDVFDKVDKKTSRATVRIPFEVRP